MSDALLEMFIVICKAAMAAFMVWLVVTTLRAGSDVWFAFSFPLAAYAVWDFMTHGEGGRR